MAGRSVLTAADLEWLREMDRPRPPKPAPRTCDRCVHFEPGPINPAAGAGHCLGVRAGEAFYPMEVAKCRGWEEG